VGQILSFRLVYDQDTGKPKGYGFAEFADKDAADSAVRNLNNYQMGGRELRVDFSNAGGSKDDSNSNQQRQAPPPAAAQPQGMNGVGPLPPGSDLPPGLTCHDAISKTLSTLPAPQLLDILSQMKGLVTGDPAKATELLRQAPQLSYAIFQALLLMGLVDSNHIASVVNESQQQAAAPPPVPTPKQQMPARPVQPPYGYAPTPPMGGGYAPPPQPTPQQVPPPQAPPSQEALLKQVLSLPQAQIDALPPAERAQIMALRQQFAQVRY
jgi:cleavage stimulation factor subunit 2